MASKRALVVDDETSVRAVVSSVLATDGYQTIQAEDAMAALETAGQVDIDLVVTDFAMPGMNGLELVRELRARGCRARFLLISGYLGGEQLEDATIPCLAKPFTRTCLIASVRKLTGAAGQQPKIAARKERPLRATGLRSARQGYEQVEDQWREALSAAKLACRTAADDRKTLIDVACRSNWKADLQADHALRHALLTERGALEAYRRLLKSFNALVLSGRQTADPQKSTPPKTQSSEYRRLVSTLKLEHDKYLLAAKEYKEYVINRREVDLEDIERARMLRRNERRAWKQYSAALRAFSDSIAAGRPAQSQQ